MESCPRDPSWRTAVAALALVCVCVACARPESAPPPPQKVSFLNWSAYTHKEAVRTFEEETGFRVALTEYSSTDEAIARLQTAPGSVDVFIADCETAPTLQKTRLIAQLDLRKIPNHVGARFGVADRRWTLPFQGCATGLAVDRRHVPAEDLRWSVLLDPAYRKRARLLDDMRETIDTLAFLAGRAVVSRGDLHALGAAAKSLVENEISFGTYLDNIDALARGEVWIAETYSGDFAKREDLGPEFEFVLPADGFRYEYDCLFLSADAPNPQGGTALIDFLLRPRTAALWTEEFGYTPAVDGAERAVPRAIARNPLVFIPPEAMRRAVLAEDPGELLPRYEQLFHSFRRDAAP